MDLSPDGEQGPEPGHNMVADLPYLGDVLSREVFDGPVLGRDEDGGVRLINGASHSDHAISTV